MDSHPDTLANDIPAAPGAPPVPADSLTETMQVSPAEAPPAPNKRKRIVLFIVIGVAAVGLAVLLLLVTLNNSPKSRLEGFWFSQGDNSMFLVNRDLSYGLYLTGEDSLPRARGVMTYRNLGKGVYQVTSILFIDGEQYQKEYYLVKVDGQDWLTSLDGNGEVDFEHSFKKGGS